MVVVVGQVAYNTVLGRRVGGNTKVPPPSPCQLEIPYGFAAQSSRASRGELDAIFERMNQRLSLNARELPPPPSPACEPFRAVSRLKSGFCPRLLQ